MSGYIARLTSNCVFLTNLITATAFHQADIFLSALETRPVLDVHLDTPK